MKRIALIAIAIILCAGTHGDGSLANRLTGSGSTDFLLNGSSVRLLAQ